MTRTHRFLGGVSLGYVYLGLVTIVGLWLTPFLLSRLGQHDLGLWLVATQILGYLMLLDFGVVALLPRETAYATGRRQNGGADDLADTIATFRRVVRWQLPVATLAAVGIWLLLPREWAELRNPLIGVLATFVVTFPLRIYHAALQGLQDHAYLGRVQLVAWGAGTVLTIALVVGGTGLVALVAGWSATQIITAAACGWRLRTRFTAAWATHVPHVTWPAARSLFGRSSWVSVSQIAQVFLNGTDVLIVGKMLGPAAVVPYACTAKLVIVLANHPQLLMQTAAPALSELRASGDRHRLGDVCAALTRAMLIVSGAVACLVLAINQLFVQWWVGPSQFAGWPLTAAVIAMMLLRHLNTTNVYALFAFGQERAISLIALADGAVTMVVSAVLVHRYGIIGAPLGSLVGVALVSLPINFWRLSHDLGVHWTYLIRQLRGWAIRFTAAAILCALMGRLVPAQGLLALLVTAPLAGVVYAVAMLPLALEPPLGKYVRAAWNPVAALLRVKRPIADGSRP